MPLRTPSFPLKVFYSYSQRDRKWLLRLKNQLRNLERQQLIATFCDREISVGTDWDMRLRAEVEQADIFLLLITENFIASEYCYDIEMKRALERHAIGEALVIPIAVDYCDWGGAEFSTLQAVPDPAHPIVTNPSKLLSEVVKKIRDVVNRIGTGQPIQGSLPVKTHVMLKSRREVPWLLPHLCDRSIQEQALFNNLSIGGSSWRRPQLLVIHGPRGEAHEAFVERLEKELLPRLFSRENDPTRRLLSLEWPMYIKKDATPRDIFGPLLAKSLDAHPLADLSHLAELLAAMDGVTLLTLTVDTTAWAEAGSVLFMNFLKFWQEWPNIPPHRSLVICLMIKYDVPGREGELEREKYDLLNKRIKDFLEDVATKDHANIDFFVLPVLAPVPRLDVEVFAKKKEIQAFLDPAHTLDWISEVSSLYKNKSWISMEELVPHLEEMLQRYAR